MVNSVSPRLTAIAGPFEGATVAINSPKFQIGRELSSQLCLNDPLVSQSSCVINREDGSFILRNQDGSNGTLVNGLPVWERQLIEGDQIRIGESLFLFLLSDSKADSQFFSSQFDENPNITQSTTILPQDRITAFSSSERLANELTTLLKIGSVVSQMRSFNELQRQLLSLIFEVIPAHFGAILFDTDYFPQANEIVWLERSQQQEQPPPISQTILNKIRMEKRALLYNKVPEVESLRGVSSLIVFGTQSLLAVPLLLYDRYLGVLYLDSKEESVQFDENHLQLLSTIAGIASVTLDNARRREQLEGEKQRLQLEIQSGHGLKLGMIGESLAMRRVYQLISKIAPSEITVALLGESGTGKELAARAIHRLSPRANHPFISINCATLTDSLLGSQLFGHRRGSFTGAVSDSKGAFETARGGTLFLDEMGELPLELQATLLRVLQEKEFTPLGSTVPKIADVRIITATNQSLEELVSEGRFRKDLYYRLSAMQLAMPSLRDRPEDIVLLAQYFTMQYAERLKRPVRGLATESRALLTNYSWPGNVRELENAIMYAIVIGTTELILPEDLPETLHDASRLQSSPGTIHSIAREAKKQAIIQALKQSGGNFTEAAKILGFHRNNLHRLIRNLGLRESLRDLGIKDIST